MVDRLGDKIAKVAQAVAREVDGTFGTNVQNCFGCKQMQSDLNAGMGFLDAVIKRMKGTNATDKSKQS